MRIVMHIVLCCSVLECPVLCSSVLCRAVLCCILYYTVLQCSVLFCGVPASQGPKSGSRGAGDGQPLSMSCQHKFIAFSDYLPHCGLAAMLQDIQAAMKKALQT